jgi:MOSC domain-containing protein YiiM
MTMELRILSVNVGRPKLLTALGHEPVLSGIAKRPVGQASIFVGKTNLDGDGQADLSVHGGFDKAIYAYPADHWSWWETKGIAADAASFGENLTLGGACEEAVGIGDRFRWGDAILEVSQPRGPCYKLAMYLGRPDAPQLMTISGRCGWYFRVISEGQAPVGNAACTRIVASGGASVRDAFSAAYRPNVPLDELRRVHAVPALAGSWLETIEKRIGARSIDLPV